MRLGLLATIGLGLGGALLPLEATADWLYFARGGQAELPAVVEGSRVRVTTPDGLRTFPRGAFRSITPGGRTDDDWRDQQGDARRDGSARALFVAGWWALERGLTPEAIATFREAATAPGAGEHAPLARSVRMLDRLEAAPPDADHLDRVRAQLGGVDWVEARGRHILLMHQGGSAADAESRLDVLDRVFATFYLSLAAQGVELPVSAQRLVSVWFARQADYVAFLRRVDAGPFADTEGYYHPTFGIVFAFDTRTSHDQVRARRAIEVRSRQLAANDEDERADLDRQTLLLDLRWRSVDLGIAAHETIHQLVAASGLAPRFDDFPHWLHEGFSAQFEVVRGGRWAGFGRANDFRLPDWRSIHASPTLGPLLRDDGLAHGYHRDRYAESWALVHFLRKTRPAEFVTFLNLLQAPRSPNAPTESARAFTAVFGPDLDRLRLDWLRFMSTQTTPLEDHARTAAVAKSF